MRLSSNTGFKGVWIPAEVWLNEGLSLVEKNFLGVIISLTSNGSKDCTATNAFFMDMFGLQKVRVSNIINDLQKKGFIEIEMLYDGKQVSGRLIKLASLLQNNITPITENCNTTITENCNTVLQENEKPYYKKVNHDNIYNKKEDRIKEDIPPLPQKQREISPTLKLPFESERFTKLWAELNGLPKWKKKPSSSLIMTLEKLSRYEENFACDLISRAIEGNYQGVVFADTDVAYERWKKVKGNGQILIPTDERRQKLVKDW